MDKQEDFPTQMEPEYEENGGGNGPNPISLTLYVTSPSNGATLTGNSPAFAVTFSGDVQADRVTVQGVRVRVGDGAWANAQGTTIWTYTHSFTSPGPYRITFEAYGVTSLNRAMTDTQTRDVTVNINDVTAPSLTIVSPANNSSISGNGIVANITVRIQALDSLSGLKRIRWTLDGVAQPDNVYDIPVTTQVDVSKTFDIPARSNAAHAIVVSAVDAKNNTATAPTLNFTDLDITAPFLTITSPQPNAKILGTPTGAVVTVRGKAEDRQRGTSIVELSLDGVTFSPATTSNGWVDWQGNVTIPPMAYKVHTITVRTRDAANNVRAETVTVEMTRAFRATNADELLSSRAYLEDIGIFANTIVSTSANPNDRITGARLQQAFYQPFDRLTDTLTTTGSEPVNQLRVAVEVLRRYLPVAHWTFNEGSGTTLADAMNADNVGTLLDNTTWRLGRIRHSLFFDAAGDAVTIASTANSKLRNLVNTFSVAFWARPGITLTFENQATSGVFGTNQPYAIVPQQGQTVYGSADHAGMGVSVGMNGINVYEHSQNYRPPLLTHTISPHLNGWVHVTIIYQDGTPSLYLNGIFVKTGLKSPKPFVHACPEAFGGGSFGRYYGFLDDIRIYDRVLAANEIAALAAMHNEWVWVEDALPAGAVAGTDASTDPWNWSHPTPLSGLKADMTAIRAGVHQQYFTGATTPLQVGAGDTLFAYVYLDPANPPTEVMVQFNDGSWEHRAYWGANSIEFGVNDTPSRRYIGTLPPTGQWVRLEVPASEIALEGRDLNGFSLVLFNGRAYLDRVGKLKAGVAAAFADNFMLPQVEALYRETIYQALLTRIGTSYTELRLARSAEETTRKALADRLGIPLDSNQLTTLLLIGNAITEKKLEELFGLPDTSRDPLAAGQESWLLREQRRYLSALWLNDDTKKGHNGAPLIDPDLITRDDLASAVSGNAAYDLYEPRRTWLTNTFNSFPTYAQIQAAQLSPFETHLRNTLPTVMQGDTEWTAATAISKFLGLDTSLRQGVNIDGTLQLLGLEMLPFRTLVRAHAMASANSLLESEWLDVRHILTQMLKRKQYIAWRQGEQQRQITLSGQFFKLSPATPQLLPWRASVQAREAWQEALRTRIKQNMGVEEALKANIATAEEIALPILRDALVRAVGAYQGVPDAAEWLYRWLLIDFKTSGSQRTTRVLQAIETLQGVLFALRAGQLDEAHPADAWQLIVDETAFDQEWRWAGSHEVWRAAMLVFFYPESMLQPNLREPAAQTDPYRLMMKDLRAAQRLTPQLARVTALNFLNRSRVSADLQKPGSATDLAAHWWLDSGTGAAAPDAAESNQAATIYGASWVGGLLHFDGKDDYVRVNTPTSLVMTNRVTLSAWVYPEAWLSSTNENTIILCKEAEYAVGIFGGGDLRWGFANTQPGWNWISTGYIVPLNQWTHIAVVYENGVVKTYANGVLRHTHTGSGPIQPSPSVNDLRIGSRQVSNTQYFRGFIYDVRVYRKALNQIEIGLLAAPVSDQLNEARLTDLGSLSREVMQIYRSNPQQPAWLPLEMWREIFYYVPMTLGLWLQQAGEYLTALDWYQTVYAYNLPMVARKLYNALTVEQNIAPVLSRGARWLQTINPHTLIDGRDGNPYTRYTLMTIARCFLEFADAEFTRDTAESIAKARSLYNMARSLLQLDDLQAPKVTNSQAFTLPNPVLEGLRLRAETQLAKLRQGRNIAGMKRQIEIYTLAPKTVSMLPTVGSGGQLVPGGAPSQLRPTPYRFNVLLERGKQLANLAQQMEGAYLAALEKRDVENYNLLKAGHELTIADLTVDLQNLRVKDATNGITLAQKQKSRVQTMEATYTRWLNAGFNTWERAMIDGYEKTREIKDNMAALDYMITSAQAMIDAASAGIATAALAFAGAAVATVGAFGRAAFTTNLNSVEERIAVAGVYASHERRTQEWELSREMATLDADIATQQILIAKDQEQIAKQEQTIAQSNSLHARAVADFLANKFTNAELYEWMSGVLAGVYNYFLQQATAMAQLAEDQLAFKRQQTSPDFIQADYWQVSAEDGGSTDRRGLTGSARLLQDIHRLDQYAFEKDKRKLNLSQTFSLAHLMPLEFQQFRQTGVLPFATPMRLFDEAFPGHYLRLIKRVRTSVIALTPPAQGIRASLATVSGVSRVVVEGDVFQEVTIRREPEMVALTSPSNATGIFEMDAQADMLLPFEGMGVDTSWEFQMPRAANPFDFDSIADVLITIEYTALNEVNYRSQVIQSLNSHVSANRTFSLRDHFPDEWYALNNTDSDAASLAARFKLDRRSFPPNVDGLKVQEFMLYVAGLAQRTLMEPLIVRIRQLPSSNPNAGVAATIASDGVADSRRSSPGAWSGIVGESPASEWELSLPNTAEVRNLFTNSHIQDIVIIITYEGMLPAWPA